MHLQGLCAGTVQVYPRSRAFLINVALQPPFYLVLIPSDPFDVVPHRLQPLLPGHLPSTSILGFTEEKLHLQDKHGGKCHKKPEHKLSFKFAWTRFHTDHLLKNMTKNTTYDGLIEVKP